MNTKILVLLFGFSLLFYFSCNNSGENGSATKTKKHPSQIEDEAREDGSFEDGKYCAEVQYYNPSTGTRNTYDLDVEVAGGALTVIHWPNNGWLDNSHFNPEDITDGISVFHSDKGYEYTVILGKLGGCGYADK